MKRPALWIVLALVSIAATFVGVRYFPRAFSIVALDITNPVGSWRWGGPKWEGRIPEHESGGIVGSGRRTGWPDGC